MERKNLERVGEMLPLYLDRVDDGAVHRTILRRLRDLYECEEKTQMSGRVVLYHVWELRGGNVGYVGLYQVGTKRSSGLD